MRDRRRIDRIVRAVTGTASASVLVLMALPLVTFSTCSETVEVPVTGYQLLTGFDSRALASFGELRIPPDLWLALVPGIAIAYVVAALALGGLTGAITRCALAAAGLVALAVNLSNLPLPREAQGALTIDWGQGANGIAICFAGAEVTELAWTSTTSWRALATARKQQLTTRKLTHATAMISTVLLTCIALAILLTAGFVVVASLPRPTTPPPPSVAQLRARPEPAPSHCALSEPNSFGNDLVFGGGPYWVFARQFNARTFVPTRLGMVENQDAVVRGRQVGGSGLVWFAMAGGGPSSDRPSVRKTDAGGRSIVMSDEFDFTWGGNEVTALLWTDEPGCYALQFDGGSTTESVTVEFK